jgi:hypothetical protein
MTNYQSDAANAHGAAMRSQIMAMQREHQAIIRDVLEAADYWGGTRSSVWKQFIADLGRNFQMIYDQRNNVKVQSAASAKGSELSAARKHSPRWNSSLGRRWPASC